MSIVLDGTTGITTPGLTNTGTETLVNLTTTGNTTLGDASTDTLNVGNGGLIKDASGNLGLGVTPSAWTSYTGVLQMTGGALAGYTGGNYLELFQNGYYASGLQKYVQTGYASKYQQNTGTHQWYVAASGSANATISFTQAMTLTASSQLLVNATSIPASYAGAKLYIASGAGDYVAAFDATNATATSNYGINVKYTQAAPNNTANEFYAGRDSTNTRFLVASNGGISNYSANNVNFASDLRLKKDIEPVQSYWNVFKSIEWKTWIYKDQTDEIKNIGVIAQELQALAPELVCESNSLPTPEGESPYLGLWENDFKMAGMSVITELVKRCEEQQALITTLTDRITALENK
jgi:hypothetical protein